MSLSFEVSEFAVGLRRYTKRLFHIFYHLTEVNAFFLSCFIPFLQAVLVVGALVCKAFPRLVGRQLDVGDVYVTCRHAVDLFELTFKDADHGDVVARYVLLKRVVI